MNTDKRAKDALLTDEHRQESAKLKELYLNAKHGLSQAAFGQLYDIGNQGTVWQCLNAKGMPISLKAARGFAKGLNCSIEDFSPRLAATAKDVGHYAGPSADRSPMQVPVSVREQEQTLENALELLAKALLSLPESQRDNIAEKFKSLATAPDSLTLRTSIVNNLKSAKPQVESSDFYPAPPPSKFAKKRAAKA